jgi:hypothetical protein
VGIVEEVVASAEWIATALTSSGYRADFAPSSLREIERFFNEQSQDGRAVPGGLLSVHFGNRIFSLGSYVGEVIRRQIGGTWQGDDDDLAAEIYVTLHLPDGSRIWPTQRAMKRFQNGPEDSIVFYGAMVGLGVGPEPNTPRRGRRASRRLWRP